LDDWYIGTTTSVGKPEPNRWFKGDIAKVIMWNRRLEKEEVEKLHLDIPKNGITLHYDFNAESDNRIATDLTENGINGDIKRCEIKTETIVIPYTIIPHRRPGKLRCLPHQDEGLIKINGIDKWAKGETTARNERRYVLQMQQGNWDYKSDGIAQLKYELIGIEHISSKAKLINVKL
jgi:hypothetical protein